MKGYIKWSSVLYEGNFLPLNICPYTLLNGEIKDDGDEVIFGRGAFHLGLAWL